ncbi:hypothetical protein PCE1_004960 [Barthelona sp. PCE]
MEPIAPKAENVEVEHVEESIGVKTVDWPLDNEFEYGDTDSEFEDEDDIISTLENEMKPLFSVGKQGVFLKKSPKNQLTADQFRCYRNEHLKRVYEVHRSHMDYLRHKYNGRKKIYKAQKMKLRTATNKRMAATNTYLQTNHGVGLSGEGPTDIDVECECKHNVCMNTSLPGSSFCYFHILNDEKQVLFKPCANQGCPLPVLRNGEFCTSHELEIRKNKK